MSGWEQLYLLYLAGHDSGVGLGNGITTSRFVVKRAIVFVGVTMCRAEDEATAAFESCQAHLLVAGKTPVLMYLDGGLFILVFFLL